MGKKKSSRRGGGIEELNITSMMDMMTIILVFLLKSYSTDDISAAGNDDMVLPVSTSLTPPKLAVNVVVSQSQILVDGEPTVQLETVAGADGQPTFQIPDADKRGPITQSLYEKLVEKSETAKKLGDRAKAMGAESDELGFQGQILLQCDRELPYSVIRDVMFTAGQAQFGEFRFVVIKGSG